MKIVLATDNTLYLPLDEIVERLNTICNNTQFQISHDTVHIDAYEIVCPETFLHVKSQLKNSKDHDFTVIFTTVPYENNYFYEESNGLVIASASNWHLLTDQPVINGLFYFVAHVLTETLNYVEPHVPNRGCVNDELMDKTGIDMGMRAASLCQECRGIVREKNIDVDDLIELLDVISSAARKGVSVLESKTITTNNASGGNIDIFLCHNSTDKPEVREFNESLKSQGLSTWFDEDDIDPGADWQAEIEAAIPKVRAAAVCVGSTGIGPWQRMELKGLLAEFVERRCRVVPVVLPTAESVPELPLFLRQFNWLDLRPDTDRSVLRLVETLRKQA